MAVQSIRIVERNSSNSALFTQFDLSSADGRPASIPLAVWFAFLLRDDIRAGRSTDNAEALRDFCCWWLIAGRDEYPAVWGVTAELVDVAMTSVAAPFGEAPRLLWFLWNIRPDLQAEFDLRSDEALAAFFCWYRLVGGTQLNYAPPPPGAVPW